MTDFNATERLLQTVETARSGNRGMARVDLEACLPALAHQADAWIWQAWLSDSPAAMIAALERALTLDPENQVATAGLSWAEQLRDWTPGSQTDATDQEKSAVVQLDSDPAESDQEAIKSESANDEVQQTLDLEPEAVLVQDADDASECEAEFDASAELVLQNEVELEAEVEMDIEPEHEIDAELESEAGLEPVAELESELEPAAEFEVNDELECGDELDVDAELDPTAEFQGLFDEASETDSELESETDGAVSLSEVEAKESIGEASVHESDQTPKELETDLLADDYEFAELQRIAEAVAAEELETVEEFLDGRSAVDEITVDQTSSLGANQDETSDCEVAAVAEQDEYASPGSSSEESTPEIHEPTDAVSQPVEDDLLQEVESMIGETEVAAPSEDDEPSAETNDDSNPAEALQTETTPPAAVSNDPSRPMILAVDDSPTVRKLVAMTLERVGYEVITAADGVAALNLLAERLPVLILSDINMPRITGYKLCKLVKKHERTRDIPVVMLSGKNGVFDKVRGQMVGCADYITKPFESHDLIDKVRQFALTDQSAHAGA